MKVLRKQELETSSIQVGDQIVIQLTGFGEFTATAQKITDKGTLFLFDDCVAEQPMNKKYTFRGWMGSFYKLLSRQQRNSLIQLTAMRRKLKKLSIKVKSGDICYENVENMNKGGYEKSDLCKWISDVLSVAFPENLINRIDNLTIPTYGQMFGHDDWYNDVMEPDDDEQLPLMKKRKNRIADFNDNYEWYWIQNATKKEVSAANFAVVSNGGGTGYGNASNSIGVRPVFWLVK